MVVEFAITPNIEPTISPVTDTVEEQRNQPNPDGPLTKQDEVSQTAETEKKDTPLPQVEANHAKTTNTNPAPMIPAELAELGAQSLVTAQTHA